MKNRTAAKVLFCAIITVIYFNGCGSGNKSQQKADTSTETLEASDLETIKDSLNLPDSTPAVSRDSRLVNKDGEAWAWYIAFAKSVPYGVGMVFQDNGSFTLIECYSVGPDYNDDDWRVTRTGTWYTDNNNIIKTFRDGRTITAHYTITPQDGIREERLVLVFDDAEELMNHYDPWLFFGFTFFKENINVKK